MVGEGGEWNFEKLGPEHGAFHHFHLGVVGAVMGLPKGVLVGYAREHRHEDPAFPFDAGALAAAGYGLGRRAPPAPPAVAGDAARPLVDRWSARRLCDLGSWEHHQIVPDEAGGGTPFVISTRSHSEERMIEYHVWSAEGDEPRFTGSVHDHGDRAAAIIHAVRELVHGG